MPYTGVIIVVFIIVHLLNFHFTDKSVPVADLVRELLSRPGLAMFYIVSLLAVALHLSHGVWSLFQSLGWDHPEWGPWRQRFAAVMAVVIGACNISIPLAVLVGVIHQ